MEEPLTHLIINWIEVDHQMILVGATDNEHWNLEKEFGGSGTDAKIFGLGNFKGKRERQKCVRRGSFFLFSRRSCPVSRNVSRIRFV